jgi:hypothetical protein
MPLPSINREIPFEEDDPDPDLSEHEADGYHYVYSTGPCDPLKNQSTDAGPYFHSDCLVCLRSLTARSAMELGVLVKRHLDGDHA